MKTDKIELVSYTKAEEVLNVITHAIGLVLPVFIILKCLPLCQKGTFPYFCVLLYAFGTALTFLCSVFYHAVKPGNLKKYLRVVDHSAIFFAVAGTVTGCVPAVFQKGGEIPAVLMLLVSWGSVIAGLVITLFFFGRFKAFQMSLYIFSALICAILGAKTYFNLPVSAFLCLISGGTILLVGCVFLRIGAKKRYIHSVFHVFIVAGLSVFCYGIYNFVYRLL